MRRPVVLLVSILALGLIGTGIWWYHYTGTPKYSLQLLVKAIKVKDYETARYFVDDDQIADSISKAAITATMAHASAAMEADHNPFSGLGEGMIQMMAPGLQGRMKDQIKDAIKEALGGNDTLSKKDASDSINFQRFKDVRFEQETVSGNTAEVVINGFPPSSDFDVKELHLRMARIPNTRNWRVVEIPEATAYVTKSLNTR